jgi:transcriptional regulator of NAD metabolism
MEVTNAVSIQDFFHRIIQLEGKIDVINEMQVSELQVQLKKLQQKKLSILTPTFGPIQKL